jgi:hypothetical protein
MESSMLSPKVRQHLEQALLEALKNHMAGRGKKKKKTAVRRRKAGKKKVARRAAKKRGRKAAPRKQARR